MANPNPLALPLRVLVDTNVMLDQLLRRDPWFTQAQPFWQARDMRQIKTYLPASSLTDLYYIGAKRVGRDAARQGIAWCLQEMGIIPITRGTLQAALTITGTDFEDDLIIACAQQGQCNYIATRDLAGFRHSPIPAREPPAIAALLGPTP
jgi:predicted nucleic acid-binding protein